ncbi:ATP-dependent helicase/deoxyribonuclease subunit B [compost metagenome]
MARKPQYSPSRLGTYQTCPRQYWFQYVRKLPRRAWANQSFGISLHRTLQQIHETGGPQKLEDGLNTLEASWTGAGYASRQEEAEALTRGKDLLAQYYADWSAQEGTPILLEKRMTAPYKDVTLLGIIDRVDRHADQSLEIIDYKSGRMPETIGASTIQQLAIYHHLIQARFEETPRRHSVHYLSSNARVSLPFTESALHDVLEGAYETIQRLEGDQRYATRADRHCHYCDYARYCEAADEAPPLED